ncbi:MAG: hypothetical protein F2667_05335, partial [Actinobacteria bacterium]|nr:hypothetical protein [Actinomycetota bacterium]
MKVAAAAPPARRLALAATVLVTVAAGLALSGVVSATGRGFPAPTPRAECGPGARPEGDVQGRVPLADHESGRAARGYLCNTRQVAHQGTTGGFKVLRYTDRLGHTCAFYDASQLLPVSTPFQSSEGTGVTVLAMDDPRRPRVTTSLTTPTMLSPHESLLLNERRGLLAAVLGNQFASVGVLEIYDVQTDCRAPRLLSRTTEAVLGHESGWAPDGRTFYAASSGGQTFAAIDVSDPTAPERLFTQIGVNYHGMRLSDDGRTLF